MKYLLVAFLLFSGVMVKAQNVGIGILGPSERLQVDSVIKIGKNATIPDSSRKNLLKFGDGNYVTIGEEFKDDQLNIKYGTLIFSQSLGSTGSGLIGIETNTPSANLDLNGTLRLRLAGAGAGKILTSDALGNATWENNAASVRSDIYSLGSTDFRSADGTPAVDISGGTGGAYYAAAYYGSIVAPVHLPHGATVTKMVIWYRDNDAENISFTLSGEYTTVNYTGGYQGLATVSSSGAAAGYRMLTYILPTPLVIDNETFGYQFSAFVHWSGTDTPFAIKGVKFYYTY